MSYGCIYCFPQMQTRRATRFVHVCLPHVYLRVRCFPCFRVRNIPIYTPCVPRPQRPGRADMRESRKARPERSASFHGRTTTLTASPLDRSQIRRPKTQPELLPRGRSGGGEERRFPAKVLVNVSVQRSLGPVQVMASAEWSVGDLVAATVRLYVKEGRRPPIPTAEPSAFGLHYSQFSLEGLDPEEKLMGLGSRNFFLCLNPVPVSEAASAAATATAASATGSRFKQAEKSSEIGISCFSFMDFLL
ncbi:uncharacterized protein At4g22758-like [Musa acuminata AAA Group]|uniref:uncharacterized protein At4g22758-like n=1 Tax=Musa acuminata AAA Group TaxID=214697 RepID=UPI0031DF7097